MKKFRSRRPIPRKKSRKLFTKTAKKVHRKNGGARVMRGGFRL